MRPGSPARLARKGTPPRLLSAPRARYDIAKGTPVERRPDRCAHGRAPYNVGTNWVERAGRCEGRRRGEVQRCDDWPEAPRRAAAPLSSAGTAGACGGHAATTRPGTDTDDDSADTTKESGAGTSRSVAAGAVGRRAPARPAHVRPSCVDGSPTSDDPKSDRPTSVGGNLQKNGAQPTPSRPIAQHRLDPGLRRRHAPAQHSQ